MIKVLLSTPTVDESVGGIARSTPELAVALKVAGCDLRLLTAKPTQPVQALREISESEILYTKLEAHRSRKDWIENLETILSSRYEPNLVHLAGIWLPFSRAVVSLAKQKEIPLILSPRGMLEPWALNSKKWKKKLAWALYQKRDLEKATAFHATAQSEAESIRRLGFKQPIAVIPNGIVLPEIAVRGPSFLVPGSSLGGGGFGPENEERRTKNKEQREAPQERGTKNKEQRTERTALFLSRINPKKGLPMLLDAWARVAPADWRLVIAGNDDSNHLPLVERKIRELGLQGQVEIAGPLFGEAKETAYRNADLFVLPSYSENFGIVVAEALGYGVPVLTTTGCPWQELKTHNCGWWVEPTPAGIENGLNEALSTKNGALSAMGMRGRKLVEEKYQWPGIADRMLALYHWLLNGGSQPEFVV